MLLLRLYQVTVYFFFFFLEGKHIKKSFKVDSEPQLPLSVYPQEFFMWCWGPLSFTEGSVCLLWMSRDWHSQRWTNTFYLQRLRLQGGHLGLMAREQQRRKSRGILLSSKNKQNGKIGILLTSSKDLTFGELLAQHFVNNMDKGHLHRPEQSTGQQEWKTRRRKWGPCPGRAETLGRSNSLIMSQQCFQNS